MLLAECQLIGRGEGSNSQLALWDNNLRVIMAKSQRFYPAQLALIWQL